MTSIGEEAFLECRNLTSINIPESVTSIGNGAFKGCSNLTSITIPDSVTRIRGRMFWLCSNLTSITIPDKVKRIEGWAFRDCSNLTSITIPDKVKEIEDGVFSGCSNLTSITISASVTSIGNSAFEDCKKLKSINIPEGVRSIGDSTFSGCSSLTSITIPTSVTSIENSAFKVCSKLKSINIPDSVTSIGDSAFHGCSELADNQGFVVIRNVLHYYASKKTHANIPEGVTSIEDYAFENCDNLTSVVIPDSVINVGNRAFYGCKKVQELRISSPLAAQLSEIFPITEKMAVVHTDDMTDLSTKWRPGAAVGFAKDQRSCIDENGRKYVSYVKKNAVKLMSVAIEYPELFWLMLREKLIAAKDLEACTKVIQDSGNTECMAAILDYANGSVSEEDKAEVQAKKEEREARIMNFMLDVEKLEMLTGKTFAATGKLKTFKNRKELKDCLTACDAKLTETLSKSVNYLITNTSDSDPEKNRRAKELCIKCITEDEFNEMIGRRVGGKESCL